MFSRTFFKYYSTYNSLNSTKSHFVLRYKLPLSQTLYQLGSASKYYSYKQIHTSRSLNALPPFLWLILKPVFKLTAALTGRYFRRRWQLLPSDKKFSFIQSVKSHKLKIGVFVTGVFVLSTGYYISHLQETPYTQRKRFVAFTPTQFQQISQHQFQTIWKDYKNDVIPASHPITQKVLKVTNQLLAGNSDIPKVHDCKWTVTVIKDATANAFVLPSGDIFVFTGMLDVCANDDQLGVVLSHEMSHAILEHGIELFSYAHLIDLIMVIVIGAIWTIFPTDGVALLFQYFSNKMTELLMHLPYNRMLENEADVFGLYLAAKACFDIRESSTFWTQMEIASIMKDEIGVEWLSTHPTHGNRSDSLNQLIPTAMEVRAQSKCPHLGNHDPRKEVESFKNALQKTLKNAKN